MPSSREDQSVISQPTDSSELFLLSASSVCGKPAEWTFKWNLMVRHNFEVSGARNDVTWIAAIRIKLYVITWVALVLRCYLHNILRASLCTSMCRFGDSFCPLTEVDSALRALEANVAITGKGDVTLFVIVMGSLLSWHGTVAFSTS